MNEVSNGKSDLVNLMKADEAVGLSIEYQAA